MARHNEIVTAFKAIETFDIENADHRLLVIGRYQVLQVPGTFGGGVIGRYQVPLVEG